MIATMRPHRMEGPEDAFDVLRPLGQGGACELHLALGVRGRLEGKRCVLKSAALGHERAAEASESIESEGAILRRLEHPNIVRSFGTVELERRRWLVLEYFEGLSLPELFAGLSDRRERLAEPVAFTVAVHLLEALAYLHQAQDEDGSALHLVHRDVAPQNLLLGFDGTTKLLDFGLSEWALEAAEPVDGIPVGTPGFMSRELLLGEPLTAKSDVYAAALLTISLFHDGRSPFDRDTVSECLLATLHDKRPSVRALLPAWPLGLVNLVEGALALKQQDRPSATRLLMEMLGCLEQMGTGLASRVEIREVLARLEPARAADLEISVDTEHVNIEALLAPELEGLEPGELPEPEFAQGRSTTKRRPSSPPTHNRS